MNNINSNTKIAAVRSILIILIIAGCSVGCGSSQLASIRVPHMPPPVTKPIEHVNVALVLSSGGFRGAAHIGAIEVLEENNIPIDLIVGCSAGSVIGACYADEPNALALKNKFMSTRYDHFVETSWIGMLKAPFYPTGPVKGKALQNFMLSHMQSRDFNDLKIPLVVVTTSLINNQVETLETGPIIPAVHASSALPPYFAPVNMYQNSYVDGGVIAPIPVSVAKRYSPKLIIVVDITNKPSITAPKNAFQITGRAIDISRFELSKGQASQADIVIRPDIIGYTTFDDDYVDDFYLAGRRAALAHLDEIKTAVLKIKQQAP
jgi:NTE family protein